MRTIDSTLCVTDSIAIYVAIYQNEGDQKEEFYNTTFETAGAIVRKRRKIVQFMHYLRSKRAPRIAKAYTSHIFPRHSSNDRDDVMNEKECTEM